MDDEEIPENFYPTLQEFLEKDGWITTSFITHDEFDELYVRKGLRTVTLNTDGDALVLRTLQLARIAAKEPRTGALRRLVQEVDKLSAGKLPIYIENLYDENAASGILSSDLGFQQVDEDRGFAACLLRLPPS